MQSLLKIYIWLYEGASTTSYSHMKELAVQFSQSGVGLIWVWVLGLSLIIGEIPGKLSYYYEMKFHNL